MSVAGTAAAVALRLDGAGFEVLAALLLEPGAWLLPQGHIEVEVEPASAARSTVVRRYGPAAQLARYREHAPKAPALDADALRLWRRVEVLVTFEDLDVEADDGRRLLLRRLHAEEGRVWRAWSVVAWGQA